MKPVYVVLLSTLQDIIKLDVMASLKKKDNGLMVLLKSQSKGGHLVHMFHDPGRGLSWQIDTAKGKCQHLKIDNQS